MHKDYSLIANTGIQLLTFPLSINTQNNYRLWFHEWFDTENAEWKLDPVTEIRTDVECYYYNKIDLYYGGFLNNTNIKIDVEDLEANGIKPLRIDDVNCDGVTGEIYNISFTDRENILKQYENNWIPIPYFFKRTEKRFNFGPLNWSRMKIMPKEEKNGIKNYDVVIAFDTNARYEADEYNECPVFPDKFRQDMDFALCDNDFMLMDYCTSGKNWSYIDEYLLGLAHPGIRKVTQIKGTNIRRMSYIASYILLIEYIAKNNLLPQIKLYKDTDVEYKDVDMVIDIGNSRTTALLIEDNSNFNQVRELQLLDYTRPTKRSNKSLVINTHNDPFDMRLVFRKVNFGTFGIKDSKQFIHPSLVRLGNEAYYLLHQTNNNVDDSLCTYSSPKRYLWDWKPNKEEWEFLTLKDEPNDHILNLQGITNQLKSDGSIDPEGKSGSSFHYCRRSLMTFAFLEMLTQAKRQINSYEYRSDEKGFGKSSVPRKIRRIIITCPTAMSKIERDSLIRCAEDAVKLLKNFYPQVNKEETNSRNDLIEIIPKSYKIGEDSQKWYYDEATCSQLVYMYGEVAHKYKGCCGEFFNLYGKLEEGDVQNSITVGSLDIGAGTSDLMINKYTYEKGDITTITPDPKFYDSYYFAGDDMLYALIKNLMLFDEDSAFRKARKDLNTKDYRQEMKNFFGPDYNGQSISDRIFRKDFNIQYSVPVMCYFLELLNQGSKDCIVKFDDVFKECPPKNTVIEYFKSKLGIDLKTLSWEFNVEKVSEIVRKEFEPLLKKVATIMYSYACDVVLLSGRPASLPVIRDIFLKYYSVSPNRLIVLNNYYVGDWYPFSQNTGYIKNPKTIVAMGGVLGHYASELSNLNKFNIDLSLLSKNLKSTINYIEGAYEGEPIEYFITPEKNIGDLKISNVPKILNVRQIGIVSYPSRALYSIDFNRYKIAEKIKKHILLTNKEYPTDSQVINLVNETIDSFKKKMPFKLTIERDLENKEDLRITAITDVNGNEIMDGNLEIHIQSLGIDNQYWLDSGAFDF